MENILDYNENKKMNLIKMETNKNHTMQNLVFLISTVSFTEKIKSIY